LDYIPQNIPDADQTDPLDEPKAVYLDLKNTTMPLVENKEA
jgi:hypothetical protein